MGVPLSFPSASHDGAPTIIDVGDTDENSFINNETSSGEYSSSVVTVYQSGAEVDSSWSQDSEDYPLEEWCQRKRATQAARLGREAGLRKSTRKRKCVDRFVGGAADDPVVVHSGTDSPKDDIVSWGGMTEFTQDSDPDAVTFIIPGVAPREIVVSSASQHALGSSHHTLLEPFNLPEGAESPGSVNSQEVAEAIAFLGLGASSAPHGKLSIQCHSCHDVCVCVTGCQSTVVSCLF